MTTPDRLSTRIDQYALTARGRAASGRSLTEIAGYAAAAGASLGLAGTADAAIIYSGVQNLTVGGNPAAQATAGGTFFSGGALAVDLDGGGADVNAIGGMVAALGGAAAKYWGLGYLQAAGGAAMLGAGANSLGVYNLAAGALIGPGGNFAGDKAGRAQMVVGYATAPDVAIAGGNFNPGSTGFAGIRLGSGNYGWIRLRVDDLGLNQPYSTLLGGTPLQAGTGFVDRLTVIDWAYNDSGAAIRAGQTVPAPTPLALLAAGAAGLAALRRRRPAPVQTH